MNCFLTKIWRGIGLGSIGLILAIVTNGCRGDEPPGLAAPPVELPSNQASEVVAAEKAVTVIRTRSRGQIARHLGCCDGSGAVRLNRELMAVVNDEDSVLRVYDMYESGAPKQTLDLTEFLNREGQEADLEALATIGNRLFGIASHARSKEGKKRKGRRVFFALDFEFKGNQLSFSPVGRPYENLLEDLTEADEFENLELKKASKKDGDSDKALNIEGLCSTPDGKLMLGFRAPVRGGDAFVVVLVNPHGLLKGRKPVWEGYHRLDMKDRGIRGLARLGATYYIASRRDEGKAKARIYRWRGMSTKPERISIPDVPDFNPESIIPLSADGGNGRSFC